MCFLSLYYRWSLKNTNMVCILELLKTCFRCEVCEYWLPFVYHSKQKYMYQLTVGSLI